VVTSSVSRQKVLVHKQTLLEAARLVACGDMSKPHSCKASIDRVSLPESKVCANLACLDSVPDWLLATTTCPLCFLHWSKVRRAVALGRSTDRDAERRAGELEQGYRSGELSFTERLAAHTREVCLEPDLVVQSPSENEFAGKYFIAIHQAFPSVRVISSQVLQKERGVYFGGLRNVGDIKSKLRLTPNTGLTGMRRLLIVDDVYSSGKTSSAIVSLLIDAGFSPEAEVSLAVPLRLLHNSRGLLLNIAGLDQVTECLTC
jgi:hypothetical protein